MPYPGRGMTLPGVRIPPALLNVARQEARHRDENLPQVVWRAVREYVGQVPNFLDPQQETA